MKLKMTYALVLVASVFWGVCSQAQLDPRERYGTYIGGGVAREFNGNCPDQCPSTFPADTVADRVTVDSAGNVFVAGHTTAIDFPVTSGAYRTTPTYVCGRSGTCDSSSVFIIKFNSSGQRERPHENLTECNWQ